MGFEYELIKHFAKQMIEWLEEGYGDIISAGLIKTPEREKLAVDFTAPYLFVKQVIVQRKNDQAIESLEALENRTVFVRKSSSYWNTLSELQEQLSKDGIQFNIELVPETMETEEIIKHVIGGQYDLTLADSHIIDIEKSWHSELHASLALTEEQGHQWMLRNTNKQLFSELNQFIKKEYKQLFYNVTYNKYFKNSRNLFDSDNLAKNNNIISPYDDLIKSLAKEYNFDWRLITAQVNKESKFNPKAKSWAGAKGLLQVMPRTAREVGISNLEKPENGLRAGVKYMAWISKQLSDELPLDVHTWFTLAAYNAGLGHLKDARNLALKQGLNPNRWFGHVEKAFLLLSRPEYYKKARYGYVRGIEPVTYIKRIQALFELYSNKHPEEA
ncbi:MAG: transporter substrate-binding domain-containing protein [gamma proteobacterium symbiont of Lucinoma myriamae]|nr:transporter substrate-binding domain-containing protein [gamma proteobacterium symbiont of Lucinoma myriamae]MCU7819150.1 transporter substrate-binding domain-containing protein [gamma proteobacterium symbiont of Lucinoma myriamae]MCU7832697.1 transporter substrate-binding domain-containing protein [gamma proteobacterium symbiont of Lucinoma myriamae]